MAHFLIAVSAFLPFISASPAPTRPVYAVAEKPIITPSPDPTRTYNERRDIISELGSDIDSLLSGLGSAIPSYIVSGVPNFFQGFPTGGDVQSSLGLDSSQVSALPTQVLNIPGYANYTDQGWNVRFHGNVFKQPNITESQLDDLANGFLIGTSVQALPPSQASQARNLTAEIYVLQQANDNVTFSLLAAATQGPSTGGAITPQSINEQVDFPYETTDEGDFDAFVQIRGEGLLAGNATQQIQIADVYTSGTDTGNATAYFVPDEGLTIISDIDDILRVTKIWDPEQGLLNSFAKPFTPWMNMPDIYANWSTSIPNFHFHYLTTTPEQITRNYMDFIYKTYPLGSFDTRPLNFSNVEETLSVRKVLLEKIFQTYPKRKFILIADTSNSDVMKDYPAMVTEFPGQVQCIFLRNTSATDPTDKFPYDTSGFAGINQQQYMFFLVPDDLTHLDIINGQCLNTTVKQNVTFSYQGLPFGISTNGSNSTSAASSMKMKTGLSGWSVLFVTLMVTIGWTIL